MVTLPSLPARTHNVIHRGLDAPPRAGARASSAVVLVQKPAEQQTAAGCQAPGTYAGALRCNAAPIRAEGTADGFPSAESENPDTRVAASQAGEC